MYYGLSVSLFLTYSLLYSFLLTPLYYFLFCASFLYFILLFSDFCLFVVFNNTPSSDFLLLFFRSSFLYSFFLVFLSFFCFSLSYSPVQWLLCICRVLIYTPSSDIPLILFSFILLIYVFLSKFFISFFSRFSKFFILLPRVS